MLKRCLKNHRKRYSILPLLCWGKKKGLIICFKTKKKRKRKTKRNKNVSFRTCNSIIWFIFSCSCFGFLISLESFLFSTFLSCFFSVSTRDKMKNGNKMRKRKDVVVPRNKKTTTRRVTGIPIHFHENVAAWNRFDNLLHITTTTYHEAADKTNKQMEFVVTP